MISTRDLALLPDVDCLRRTLQSMAMLDAILYPVWHFRYYSFNAAWAEGEHPAGPKWAKPVEFPVDHPDPDARLPTDKR